MQDGQSIEGAECGVEPGPVTLSQPALGSWHSSPSIHIPSGLEHQPPGPQDSS